MKKMLKSALIGTMLLAVVACDTGSKNSGEIVFESADKKVVVYKSELDKELEKLSKEELDRVPAEQLEAYKKQIIQQMALEKGLVLDAKEKKIEQTKEYKDGLARSQDQYLAGSLLEKEMKAVTITDEEVKEGYNKNIAQFERKEEEVSLQILGVPAGTPEQKAQADAILKEALASGNIDELVQKYNPETPNKGVQPFAPVSAYAQSPALKAAIDKTEKGKVVSELIIEGNMAVVLKVIDKKEKGVIPFDEIKDGLKAQLLNNKKQEATKKLTDSIFEKYNLDSIIK